MRASATNPAGRLRTARHRERLRRQSLRLVQIWVPDTRAPGFAAEAARQACAVAATTAPDDFAFLDRLAADVLDRE